MGYKRDTIRGVSWLGAFRIVTRIMSFVRTAIVARILTPKDFGLFGIATITLSLIEVFTETGINIFLIQQKDEADKFISTAWIVSIIRGCLIGLLIYIFAPFISSFFHSSSSEILVRWMALVPLVRGFINPSVAKFIKDLEFHKEFIYRTAQFVVESLATLLFVLIRHDALSLVFGLIVGAMFEAGLSFLMAHPRPRFAFEKQLFRRVIHYGKWLTAAGIFDYLYQNADNIVVGRVLGTTSLGFYSMAYRISSVPISEFSDVFSRATFPVYAKISDDKARLLSAFYKSLGMTTLLVAPVGIIFFFFPEFIVGILLGDQWLSVASVLRMLALFGVLRAISNLSTGLFYSINRQDVVTKTTFISLVGLLIPIVPLVSLWGIWGAASSALIGTVVAYPVIIYYLYQLFYKQVKS